MTPTPLPPGAITETGRRIRVAAIALAAVALALALAGLFVVPPFALAGVAIALGSTQLAGY